MAAMATMKAVATRRKPEGQRERIGMNGKSEATVSPRLRLVSFRRIMLSDIETEIFFSIWFSNHAHQSPGSTIWYQGVLSNSNQWNALRHFFRGTTFGIYSLSRIKHGGAPTVLGWWHKAFWSRGHSGHSNFSTGRLLPIGSRKNSRSYFFIFCPVFAKSAHRLNVISSS